MVWVQGRWMRGMWILLESWVRWCQMKLVDQGDLDGFSLGEEYRLDRLITNIEAAGNFFATRLPSDELAKHGHWFAIGLPTGCLILPHQVAKKGKRWGLPDDKPFLCRICGIDRHSTLFHETLIAYMDACGFLFFFLPKIFPSCPPEVQATELRRPPVGSLWEGKIHLAVSYRIRTAQFSDTSFNSFTALQSKYHQGPKWSQHFQ